MRNYYWIPIVILYCILYYYLDLMIRSYSQENVANLFVTLGSKCALMMVFGFILSQSFPFALRYALRTLMAADSLGQIGMGFILGAWLRNWRT